MSDNAVLWDREGEGEPITLRPTSSYGMAIIGRTHFRCIERYLANGRRDTSRCRYFINGRMVKHAKYQRRMATLRVAA